MSCVRQDSNWLGILPCLCFQESSQEEERRAKEENTGKTIRTGKVGGPDLSIFTRQFPVRQKMLTRDSELGLWALAVLCSEWRGGSSMLAWCFLVRFAGAHSVGLGGLRFQ
nr:hypothetical protein CFP56_56612 [Quercus suber]